MTELRNDILLSIRNYILSVIFVVAVCVMSASGKCDSDFAVFVSVIYSIVKHVEAVYLLGESIYSYYGKKKEAHH